MNMERIQLINMCAMYINANIKTITNIYDPLIHCTWSINVITWQIFLDSDVYLNREVLAFILSTKISSFFFCLCTKQWQTSFKVITFMYMSLWLVFWRSHIQIILRAKYNITAKNIIIPQKYGLWTFWNMKNKYNSWKMIFWGFGHF